jgi:hypothetical protein
MKSRLSGIQLGGAKENSIKRAVDIAVEKGTEFWFHCNRRDKVECRPMTEMRCGSQTKKGG